MADLQKGDHVTVYLGQGLSSGHWDGIITKVDEYGIYTIKLDHPTCGGTTSLCTGKDRIERI
jgi:hypothetical protein